MVLKVAPSEWRIILFIFVENSLIQENSDPSDRTLIRVLRSEFEAEEKEQASLKNNFRKSKKGANHSYFYTTVRL